MNKSENITNSHKSIDLSTLRLNQNFAANLEGEKVTTTIPVRKPNKQEFIRTIQNPDYWFQAGSIEDEELRELYIVIADLQPELMSEWRPVMLVPTISRQGTFFLWPIKLPPEDGRTNTWNHSAMQAAITAKDKWLRVISNMSLQAYEPYVSSIPITEPAWPEMKIEEIIEIAFRGKIIDSLAHPFVLKLQGKM